MIFYPNLLAAILLISVGLMNLLLSLLVVVKPKKTQSDISFTLLCFCLALWCFAVGGAASGFPAIALIAIKVVFIATIPMPFFLLLFSSSFPSGKTPYSKMDIAWLALPALILLASFGTDWLVGVKLLANGSSWIQLGPLNYFFLIYCLAYFIWSALNLIPRFRASSPAERMRYKYFFVGIFLTVTIGTFFNLIMTTFFRRGALIYYGPLSSIFVVALTAYAILKTELMDIRVVISRSVAYGASILAILLLWLSIIFLNLYFIPSNHLSLLLSLILLLIASLVIFEPIREFIQTPLEEKWIVGGYDPNRLINIIAEKLIPALERQTVLQTIARELKETIKIKWGNILLARKDPGPKDERVIPPGENTQEIPVEHPLSKFLSTSRKTVPYDSLPAGLKEAIKGTPFLAGVLYLPLYSSEALEGIIILGPKISEDPYTEKDLILFRTISWQAQAILDRIRPYEEVKRNFNAAQQKLIEIAAGVAHEIRNPLTVIQAKTESLPDKIIDERTIIEYKAFVLEYCARINSIIRNILSLARAGGKSTVATEVQLDQVLNSILDNLNLDKIKLTKELAALPIVMGDPEEFRQIFVNLLDNARQAMPAGGTLLVKASQQEKNLIIEIADTGCGIAKDDLPKIFDNFYTTRQEGTGVGLAMVARLVQKYHGEIRVESEPGKGTTFVVKIPTGAC